ncbi:unnamed protein product, partial [Discosporangium mesarthrocarpum]
KGGHILIKGFPSERRSECGLVRRVVRGVIERLLPSGGAEEEGARRAVEFVKHEVRRLLTGGCTAAEVTLTTALWRSDGQDIRDGAAGIMSLSGPGTSGPGQGGGRRLGVPAHVSLAQRLQRRDPHRTFLLGERLPLIFVEGGEGDLQSEKAEDPIVALKEGNAPDYSLYWEKKLSPPLGRIFRHVLSESKLNDLLNGSHTKSR